MSTTCKRQEERVRTCLAQVLGKAGTDPLERRNRRRTEADDGEQEVSSSRHRAAAIECHGSTGSVRQSSPVHTAITRGSRLTLTCKPLMLLHTTRGHALPHSHSPVVIWSSSANQTQLLKKREVRSRNRFPREDWTSLDKAPHNAAEESSVVMARRSQKQPL